MSLPDIRSLLPHSGQMVLLDRVTAVDADTLCAEVELGPGSLFCDGVAAGSWVGIEYMAQAVAAHAGYLAQRRGEPVRIGFLLGTRRYECNRPRFIAGSVLCVHVRLTLQGDNGLAAYECVITGAGPGAVSASATVTVFQPADAAQFLGEDAR